MNIFVAAPRSFAGNFFAQSIRIFVNRCIRAFLAALILMFAGNAYAVITVGLSIENDLDSNGNITVINGGKVKVAYAVIEDTDNDLKKSDKIQLLRVSDDSVVASVARGKKKSGTVSLKVKNSEGEQLYVRYIRKSGTVIATAPDQVTSIANASLADLTIEQNALNERIPGIEFFSNTGSVALSTSSNPSTEVAQVTVSVPPGNGYVHVSYTGRANMSTQPGNYVRCYIRTGTNPSVVSGQLTTFSLFYWRGVTSTTSNNYRSLEGQAVHQIDGGAGGTTQIYSVNCFGSSTSGHTQQMSERSFVATWYPRRL